MKEVTLEEVLAAREQRVRRQDALLARHRAPVISFTMNVPGPVKDTPLIRRAFAVGCRALQSALDEAGLAVAERSETLAPTGCEL
nr:citrate lyase holo-[acyl-carrier protein] synthase [Oscillospiraceae bacterium]